MITVSVALSITLMAAALVHITLGGYSLFIDSRSKLNKVFFLTTISLFIWALSFSLAIVSPNEQTAFFWRRAAALGWGSFYCLMGSFIILLTLADKIPFGKRKKITWLMVALFYLPAFVTIHAFSISETLSRENYSLVMTYLGWRNMAVHSVWDSFFYIYYISYSITGLLLMFWWSRKASFTRERRQAKLILTTLLIAFFFGSFTDIVLDYTTDITLPELGVLYLTIPMAAILYSIKKYRLMSLTPSNISEDILKHMNDGLILLDHKGIIQMVNPSCCKLLGVRDDELVGSSLQEILSVKDLFVCSNEEYKKGNCSITGREILILMKDKAEKPVMFSAAPIADAYDDLIGVVCILTDLSEIKQRENDLKKAQEQLEEKVRERTSELSDINELQRLLFEISSDFISISEHNFDDKVLRMFKRVGTFIGADRAYGIRFNNQNQTMSLAHVWYKDDSIMKIGARDPIPLSSLHWSYDIFVRERSFYIYSPNAIPPDAIEENKLIEEFQIKSLLIIPVETHREITGLIGFDTVHEYKQWNENQINIIRLLANILSDGVTKLVSEQEIHQLAFFDHLTELPNRTEFIRSLDEQLRVAEKLCVLFIDLDNFKAINDTIGHNGGNIVLKSAAERLIRVIGPVGKLSRIGGDEFIAYIDRCRSKTEMELIAVSILEHFSEPFVIENERFIITVSIGLSLFPEDGELSDELIKNADLAMYEAKSNGKNRYRVCTDHMKDEAKSRNRMINLLFNGMDHDELVLHYQPQINLLTNEIIGAEALLRWNSPELGMIPPGIFIPLAEKHGLINKIGMWVLRSVCEQIKQWEQKGLSPIKVGINVSIEQLKEASFVEEVRSIISEYEIKTEYVEFEITESIIANEIYDVIDKLHLLKSMGIHISIDDFGSEYSSLRRLKDLPIDRIKVDREFLRNISHDVKNQAILKVIIQMARLLGLEAIIEGVETEEELNIVKALKCEETQGFYYYRPLPAQELEKLLSLQEQLKVDG